jgi:4-amino-4-deoxy-L-arabinose transferase-like glycosyltransferase
MVWRAFLLRAAVSMVLHFAGISSRFAPDEDTYFAIGRGLALYWSGEVFTAPGRLGWDEPFAYYYLNAFSYALFGSAIPLKIVNALMGALVCHYAYRMAEALYGPSVARRTAVFVAYFPSLVLWSSLNIRDVWIVFLLVFLSWKSYEMVVGYSSLALVQVFLAIALLSAFRPYLFLATAIPPVVAVSIGKRGKIARNLALATIAGAAAVFLAQQGAAAKALGNLDLEGIAERRRFLATGAGSAFEETADISTPERALAFLPRGLVYFWFSPFPWQMRSALQLLSLPEMLMIYALTIPTIRGISFTIRNRLREAMQPLLLTALLTLAYALGSGNVGTLYRHRAQSIVFYLMFGAVGLDASTRRQVRAGAAAYPATAVRTSSPGR